MAYCSWATARSRSSTWTPCSNGRNERWPRGRVVRPAHYRFTANEEFALFTEFKSHGGQGVEVVTGSHSSAEAARYADVAAEFDLLASRGSDFRSPTESHVDLGTLPPLPSRLRPVWDQLADRVRQPG